MTAYLFEIAIGNDTYCFSLTAETFEEAELMIANMSKSVFVGEMEMPTTLFLGNETRH